MTFFFEKSSKSKEIANFATLKKDNSKYYDKDNIPRRLCS